MTKPEKLYRVYASVNEDEWFVDTAMGFVTVADFVEYKTAYIHHAMFYSERDLAPLIGVGDYTFDRLVGLAENEK